MMLPKSRSHAARSQAAAMAGIRAAISARIAP